MKIEDVYFKSKIIYCNYNLYITLMLWCFGAISGGVDGCWGGVKSAFCALFCHFFIKKQKMADFCGFVGFFGGRRGFM